MILEKLMRWTGIILVALIAGRFFLTNEVNNTMLVTSLIAISLVMPSVLIPQEREENEARYEHRRNKVKKHVRKRLKDAYEQGYAERRNQNVA